MSAFVVNTDTLNKIVSEMVAEANEDSMREMFKVADGWFYYPLLVDDCQRLINDLHAMNVRAVNQRYGEDEQPERQHYTYQITRKIDAYKALRCFLYQCSEGDVPDEPLFKAMHELSNDWAHNIVIEMPEYDKQPWG